MGQLAGINTKNASTGSTGVAAGLVLTSLTVVGVDALRIELTYMICLNWTDAARSETEETR